MDTVTGGGSYCITASGVHIGLSGSDTGVLYELYKGGTTTVASVPGTGTSLDFGLITNMGNYTVVAINSTTSCQSTMDGTAVVSTDTLITPVVSISGNPGANILAGEKDSLNGVATAGGGPHATYQWVVNSTYIAGATNANYVSSAFSNNDSVTCIVTNTSACGTAVGTNYIIINITNVGVPQIASSGSDIRLMPNPNKGVFTIKGTLGSTGNESVTLEVTNMLGQIVYKNDVIATNGAINEQLILNNSLANGMYILNVLSATENKVFHFVMEK